MYSKTNFANPFKLKDTCSFFCNFNLYFIFKALRYSKFYFSFLNISFSWIFYTLFVYEFLFDCFLEFHVIMYIIFNNFGIEFLSVLRKKYFLLIKLKVANKNTKVKVCWNSRTVIFTVRSIVIVYTFHITIVKGRMFKDISKTGLKRHKNSIVFFMFYYKLIVRKTSPYLKFKARNKYLK